MVGTGKCFYVLEMKLICGETGVGFICDRKGPQNRSLPYGGRQFVRRLAQLTLAYDSSYLHKLVSLK